MGKRRVVIVGASAAGLRCASRLARLEPDWHVTVVEQGDVFSYAACGMPYVLSGDIGDAIALRQTGDGVLRDADYFSSVKGVEVLSGHRAIHIEPSPNRLWVESKDGERQLEWDELVLATGARPRRLAQQPDHPRVRSFHAYEDIAPLHNGLAKGEIESVIIVGAGLVGCELAEAFGALWGAEVTLVEAAESPLPGVLDRETAGIVSHALRENDVHLHTRSPVERIEASDGGVAVVAGGESLEADCAVVATGVEPVVELARTVDITIGTTGAIAVDERLATSKPNVWAVGDCAQIRHAVTGEACYFPLGSLANRQGRTLANVLAGRDDRFPAVAGAVAVKVFDCNAAGVGLTFRQAEKRYRDARTVCVSAQDRPHYWPETKDIALQIVYQSASRRVLGVQVVGEGDVTKRVDVATQLIQQGATLGQLAHLEHAYAPPYSPALDPLAVLAFAALNAEDGIEAASPFRVLEDTKLLDVRHSEEIEARPLPAESSAALPLAQIRTRVGELEDGPWLVVCERGMRSAETVRVLREKGISAQYLGGGMKWLISSGKAGQNE